MNKINLRISLKTPAEPEEAVDTFTSVHTAAAISATPMQLPIKRSTPSYFEQIVQLVKRQRKARYQWQRIQ